MGEAGEYKNDPISVSTQGNTLFLHVRKFTARATRQLTKVLQTSSQYETLVLDLRHCPGGDLYAMGDMLSLMLPSDLEVASIVKANGKKELTLKTLPGRLLTDIPIYVLISEFTASTAELFTWALRNHYGDIKLLGKPTQGKCLAQEIFKFDDSSALKLTTYEVKTASNQTCQDSPLVPDIPMPRIALADLLTIHNALASINRSDSDK